MNSVRVLWVRVWGIAALQGAITLCWVIYNLYLPLLLVQVGLSKELGITLLIIENILEAIIEPAFGWYSDRQLQIRGTKLPIITKGIMLASLLFILIPCLVIFLPNIKWLLPILVVAWASVMAVFRSPAIALLGRATPSKDLLPQAASILSLVGGLVGAFRFDAYGIILKLGAGFTFALGSIVLLTAGFILLRLNPPAAPHPNTQQPVPSKWRLGLLFAIGIFVGWGLRFLIPTIGQIVATHLGSDSSNLGITGFFVVLGISALPAGQIGTKLGNVSAMVLGCCLILLMSVFASLISLQSSDFIALLFIALGLSLVLNGAIPFALNLVPSGSSGLGVGSYFGGFSAGVGLFEFIFTQSEYTYPTMNITGIIFAFSSLLMCLLLSQLSKEIPD